MVAPVVENNDVHEEVINLVESVLSDIGDASNLVSPVTPAAEVEEPQQEIQEEAIPAQPVVAE